MTTAALPPLECWLPSLQRFEHTHPIRAWLRRGDRLPGGAQGYLDGLAAYFDCGRGMPAAALIRDYLKGDAGSDVWLSADPAWVQPDLSGARLMACGQLQLGADEAQALMEPLKPVFADEGMTLEISSPDHWQLRLSPGTPLPTFTAPEQALGADLYDHLPQGPDGRRWRVLLNEAQVLLHQHPVNAQRRMRGLPPVNSVWFWGGGVLPGRVSSAWAGVLGEDVLLLALASRARVSAQPRDAALSAAREGWLIDLQDQSPDAIGAQWWPALQALVAQQAIVFAFASGERFMHRPWHRLRFWRRGAR